MLRTLCTLLLLLSVLQLGGCLSTVFHPTPLATPPPPTFEDGFRKDGTRSESGVPLFNKIPFLSRHFTSVTQWRGDFFWDDSFALDVYLPVSATVSEDGTWLLVGRNQGGAVSIYNLHDAQDYTSNLVASRNDGGFALRIIPFRSVPGSEATWLAMLPNNSAFLVYRIRRNPETPVLETMELFDRKNGLLLRAFPIEAGFQTATLSPDGTLLYCVGQTSLEAWNIRNGEKIVSVPLHTQEGVTQLRCTNAWLFLATQSGRVKILDRNTFLEVTSISTESVPILIDISPDGKTLLVACAELETAFSMTGSVPAETKVSPDGNSVKVLYSTSAKEPERIPDLYCYKMWLYEIGTWNTLREITPDDSQDCGFTDVRFTSGGNRLIGRGWERTDKLSKLGMPFGWPTMGTFLAEYDLAEPSGQWRKLEYSTLPLHPEGKFFLGGRNCCGGELSPLSEQFRMEHAAKK